MPLLALQKLAMQTFRGKAITPAHLLVVWADDDEKELSTLLSHSGLSIGQLKDALALFVANPAKDDADLFRDCVLSIPEGMGATGWHLLRTVSQSPERRITQALVQAGMDLDGLKKGLDEAAPQDPLAVLRGKVAKASPLLPLLKYGRDLTEEAAKGAFDDLAARPKEMESLRLILSRKYKRCPVLTGPAGAGKTALVELLARDLASGKVPGNLAGTRLFEVRLGQLVAGTKYRGDFEERFYAMVGAVQQAEPAILFIDEFHEIWGAGRAEGAPMDAANMLKPLLNRGGLRIIGATTSEEYHRYITADPALDRRFSELRLEAPSGELLLQMVRRKADELQKDTGVAITDTILGRAVELTDLHLPNYHQPDKTITLLDDSVVRASNRQAKELTEDDLLRTLEAETGRPLGKLSQTELLSLGDLAQRLRRRIVGQDEAIDRVASTLIYRRQDLGETERNLGSFLFVGSSGVGKTELARSLAVAMFDDEEALLRLDMAEYSGFDAIQKLIGTSRAFASSQAGVLVSWLYSHGSGVLLFDEIEKAHHEVRLLLLGMLDRGRIRSARGEELDTRRCVVVLTSNAIKPEALERDAIGFGGRVETKDVMALLSDVFPREFLGRLDETILFRNLADDDLRKILQMRLEEALSRFARQGVAMRYDEERLIGHLLRVWKEARGSASEARALKRLLERNLLQPLGVELASYQGDKPVEITLGDEFYETGRVRIGAGPESVGSGTS